MAVKIILRHDTAANWTSFNPTLTTGEVGLETDTLRIKIGDGTTAWSSLGYATTSPAVVQGMIDTAVNNIIDLAPSTLDTLNELAAAVGDDPAFFTTVATNLSNHANATTNVHGVSGEVVGTENYQTIRNKTIGPSTSLGWTLNADNHTITALPTPVELTDAATKGYVDSSISAVVDGSPALLNTLNELSAAIADDPNFATTVATSIGTKVSKSGDTMTGPLTLPGGPINALHAATKGYIDDELIVHNRTTDVHGISDAANLAYQVDVSNAISLHNSQLLNVHGISNTENLAYLNGPTFTGTVTLPSTTSIGMVTSSEIAVLHGITATTAEINTLDGITASVSELNILDGATVTAPELNVLSGIAASTAELNILNGVTVTATDINQLSGVTAPIQAQIDAKAPIFSPTFTGTVSGITKAMVGLGSVDNTADLDKPISTATQSALDLKAPINNPTFTGTVAGIDKTMVGLSNVDNTSDANKPISTATQAALNLKANSADIAELAQDAVGNALSGTSGLVYDDVSGGISIQTNYTMDGGIYVDGTNNGLSIDRAVVVTKTDTQTLTNKTINTASNDITIVAADISDVTATATELNYVDGVTSAIQTQLDSKAALSGATFTGNVAISATTASTSTTTGALVIAGGIGTGDSAYIGGDLVISGNFTVNGTTTTVNATDLTITDPLIYVGEGNTANSADLGLVASFNDGTYQHTGLVRDSSDAKWKLFKGVTDEPTSTVNFTQGSLDALAVGAFEATSATIGNVSNTELQYLDGVTSAIQTQLDAKAPSASPTLSNVTITGTLSLPSGSVTSAMIADGTIVNADISASAAIAVSKLAASTISGVTLGNNLNTLTIGTGLSGTSYNGSSAVTITIDSTVATLTGTQTLTNKTITLASGGVTFSDGTTQTTAGVPSITTISGKTASYTLSSLAERDTIIEINNASATTLTIPADSSVNFPVGTTLDLIQTGAGQITVAGAVGVTVNATPGLKLRTQWSSATLLKRAANTWLVYGDLTA